jgi:hypothetical protein
VLRIAKLRCELPSLVAGLLDIILGADKAPEAQHLFARQIATVHGADIAIQICWFLICAGLSAVICIDY